MDDPIIVSTEFLFDVMHDPNVDPRRRMDAAVKLIERGMGGYSRVPRQDLPHQHVRRLNADTNHPGEQPHHRMRPCIGCPLEPLGTCLLDRAYLLTD
jgi:hypothetical protein